MLRAVRSAVAPFAAYWRARSAARQAQAFDARYGTDTVARVPVAQMRDIPAALAAHAVHYEPSTLPKVRQALTAVVKALGDRVRRCALLDVGSGKGLVVMQAARYPFREVVGVELAPELHAVAVENAARFTAVHPDAAPMRFVQGDALTCSLPDGPLVVYLYNPFDETLLAAFASRLEAAVSPDREILIAYVNPVHREILDDRGRYERLWDNGRVVVYRCLAAAPRP